MRGDDGSTEVPVLVSMTLPTMAGGLDRETTLEWCRRIDDGPFHTLAVGERVAFDNLEMFTTLAFAAAATERVRIAPTLVVLPMHPAVKAAKMLATLDVLSGGRVTAVVGVGGREQDYTCYERPFRLRFATQDAQVAEMRRLWGGGPAHEGAPPVGPAPVQPGGPPLLSGSLGPKSLARAARWADGVMGFTLAPDTDDHGHAAEAVRRAWREAGRPERPHLATSFWYAVDGRDDEAATAELRRYATRYLRVFGQETAEVMASLCTAAGPERVAAALAACEAAGYDEVFLVPTSADPAHLDELVALL